MMVNPDTAKKVVVDPTPLKGGEDFRLFEERDAGLREIDPKQYEVQDWTISPIANIRPGDQLGKALIRDTTSGQAHRGFAVRVLSGELSTKADLLKSNTVAQIISDPARTYRDALRDTLGFLGENTHCAKIMFIVDAETPLTVEGGKARFVHREKGRLRRRSRTLGEDSQILKAVLGDSDVPSTKIVGEDIQVLGQEYRKMAAVQLTGSSQGALPTKLGVALLLNRRQDNIRADDVSLLKTLAPTIANELMNKRETIIDSISGALDRDYVQKTGARFIEQNRDTPGKIVVAGTDLDNFREHVNEPFGHDEGTRVIRQYAAIAQRTLGDDGFMAAFGGDEFTIFTWDGGKAAHEKLEKIRKDVEGHRFTVNFPAEKKDTLVKGNRIKTLKTRQGEELVMITQDTKIQEADGILVLSLPPGTVTVTMGVAGLDEVAATGEGREDYESVRRLAFTRMKQSKSRDMRNTVYPG